jgi:cytochrome b561
MMTNGGGRIGLGTRALHWTMAAGIFATLPIGLWIANAQPSLAIIKWFGIHKTIGITLLALVIVRLLWHRITPPPGPIPGGPAWADRLARLSHRGFYVLLLLVPLSGWVGSSASGLDTVVFGRWTVPAIAPASPAIERTAFAVHGLAALLLAALIVLHVAGAAKRALGGDGTLRRMITGTSLRG